MPTRLLFWLLALAEYLGQLDSSSSYSGNGSDYVYVVSDYVTGDATWQLLDVDHFVAGDVYIAGTARPHVDIEAGTTWYFDSAAGLMVGSSGYGSLNASGTASAPITFTTDDTSPSAGDWDGLYFGYYCEDASMVVSHAVVEYGGANGYGDIYMYYCDASISDTTVSYSSNWGIYRTVSTPTLSGITYTSNASGDLY